LSKNEKWANGPFLFFARRQLSGNKKPLVGAFSTKTLARDVDLPITVFARDYTVATLLSLLMSDL
jgi:hypothetical protein